MNQIQTGITIGLMVLGTAVTRFIPFFCFPGDRKIPVAVIYLGKVLPFSIMGMLIVYCLKGVSVTSSPFGLPELIAILVVVLLYIWKRNTLLSIGSGTLLYMLLQQAVFIVE